MTDALTPTEHRSQAYVLAPGEAGRNPTVKPGIKADSTDTAGLLSVFHDTLAPWRSGPPLHLHGEMDEAWYVVEGALVRSSRWSKQFAGGGKPETSAREPRPFPAAM